MFLRAKQKLNGLLTGLHVRTGGLYGRLPDPAVDPMLGAVQPYPAIVVRMRVIRADGTVEEMEYHGETSPAVVEGS